MSIELPRPGEIWVWRGLKNGMESTWLVYEFVEQHDEYEYMYKAICIEANYDEFNKDEIRHVLFDLEPDNSFHEWRLGYWHEAQL